MKQVECTNSKTHLTVNFKKQNFLTLNYSAHTLRNTNILVCLDHRKTRRPNNVEFFDGKV